MKTTIEFDLPEDRADFDIAMKANTYRACLSDTLRMVRDKIKYDDKIGEYEVGFLEEVKAFIVDTCPDVWMEP